MPFMASIAFLSQQCRQRQHLLRLLCSAKPCIGLVVVVVVVVACNVLRTTLRKAEAKVTTKPSTWQADHTHTIFAAVHLNNLPALAKCCCERILSCGQHGRVHRSAAPCRTISGTAFHGVPRRTPLRSTYLRLVIRKHYRTPFS